jgi:pimeloyl-ACP methyl ester carboxylesterase
MIDRSVSSVAELTNKLTFSEHYIPQGQGRVFARDYPGAAPAFVVMHGLPDNSSIYDDLIPFLVAAGRRVIAFDFLGFGASDKRMGRTTALSNSFRTCTRSLIISVLDRSSQ